MTIIVKSKIEKGSIRLPKKVSLPDGTRVVVRIEPVTKAKENLKSFQNYLDPGLMIQRSRPFSRR
jgi:Protein of unknown function DUF104.